MEPLRYRDQQVLLVEPMTRTARSRSVYLPQTTATARSRLARARSHHGVSLGGHTSTMLRTTAHEHMLMQRAHPASHPSARCHHCRRTLVDSCPYDCPRCDYMLCEACARTTSVRVRADSPDYSMLPTHRGRPRLSALSRDQQPSLPTRRPIRLSSLRGRRRLSLPTNLGTAASSTASGGGDDDDDDSDVDAYTARRAGRPGPPPVRLPRPDLDSEAEDIMATGRISRRRRHHHVRRGPRTITRPATHATPRNYEPMHRLWQQLRRRSAAAVEPPRPPTIYKLSICGRLVEFKFNRTALNGLMDQVTSAPEIICSVLLAALSVFLAFQIDQFYDGLAIVVLWAVVAGAQFSLIKSVQPDSASASLDDRSSAYSRPLYFCLLALLALAFDHGADAAAPSTVHVYGVALASPQRMHVLREVVLIIILFLPLIHLLGILPRWRTLAHYLAEQIDLHLFGGAGTHNLLGALGNCARSLLFVLVGVGLAVAAAQRPADVADVAQPGLFSLVCGVVVATAFLNARLPSDPRFYWQDSASAADSPTRAQRLARTAWDGVWALAVLTAVMILHLTGLFDAANPHLFNVLAGLTSVLSAVLHYGLAEMRANHPLRALREPLLGSVDGDDFNPQRRRRWFEHAAAGAAVLELHVLYPLLTVAAMTRYAPALVDKFGTVAGAAVLVVTSAKLARRAYAACATLYPALIFTLLFFNHDYAGYSETFLLDLFVFTLLANKFYELWLKLRFAYTYTAPWNIKDTWGSGFHAFLYPFHVPHTAALIANALIAAVFSAPMYPFRGSTVFLVSYLRPLRFWEREYHTVHMDQNSTRLATKYDAGARANNLNALFYRHQLQKLKLCLSEDIAAGRFGSVQPGDVFILLDHDNRMTSFLHIVEMGNGYVGFQLRGLEFTGTFCQAREVEALEVDVRDERGCCCSGTAGSLPGLLACNPLTRLRWQTWRQVNPSYVLPGYSVSPNPASSMFQSFELRQAVVR